MYFKGFKTKVNFCNRKRASLACAFAAVFYLAESTVLWAAEEAAEGAAQAKLDPLAWKSDLALWTAVVFLLVLVVLGKFAFGPIVKALDQREKNELDRLESVERANADAKALLEEYRHKLSDSEAEVRQIIFDAQKDAAKQAESIVADARKAAADERERALKDIQNASDSALQELAVKSADIATELAGKILKERIDASKHSQLIEEAVQKITQK